MNKKAPHHHTPLPLICTPVYAPSLFSFHILTRSFSAPQSSPLSLLRPAPADGYPLWFVLRSLEDGAELHAGVLQIVVHQNLVEKLFVLGLHQPGRLLQLHKVILLHEWKHRLYIFTSIFLHLAPSPVIFVSSGIDVVGGLTVNALLTEQLVMIRAFLRVCLSLSRLGALMKIT